MRYLSTFTGIGGFEIGINNAIDGAECIGYSEVDKHAIETYESHYEHKNYGDITAIDAAGLPDFDLIVGGFPCQAFSVAGKRRGFEEARGTLFFDVARLLKHKRPRHLVLENVKGLLSHDGGKTIETIARVLADLGYRIEWQVLNSKDFGVPQNRERIYIVGHLRGECTGQVFPIFGDDRETENASTEVRRPAQTLTATYHKGSKGSHIIETGSIWDGQSGRVYSDKGLSPTLSTMTNGGLKEPKIQISEATKKGYAEATVGDTINISIPTSKTRRGRVQKGLAGTLQTTNHMATVLPGTPVTDSDTGKDSLLVRRLTPVECERLQGFPDNWTLGSDTQRYKQCGNAVTTNVVEAVMTRLKDCLQ